METENIITEQLPVTDGDLTAFDEEWNGASAEDITPDTEDTEPDTEGFELKHLGEVTTVDRERVIALAQMGLDYERVRSERDALRPLKERNEDMERTLAAIADEQNTSVEGLIHHNKVDTQSRRAVSLADFARERSDIAPEDIPQSVWQEFHRTGDLSAAYAKYENASLRSLISAMKQNTLNSQRSTGSMATGGTDSGRDAFDAGWGE